MAAGVSNYMEVMAQMTPEEKQQLLDSVKNYDTNVKNKILKAHLDAKAQQLGIVPTPTAGKGIDVGQSESMIANKAEIEKANPGMTVDATGNLVPITKKIGTLFKKPVAVVHDYSKDISIAPVVTPPMSVGAPQFGVTPAFSAGATAITPTPTVTPVIASQDKARYDKSLKDVAISAIYPFTAAGKVKTQAELTASREDYLNKHPWRKFKDMFKRATPEQQKKMFNIQ